MIKKGHGIMTPDKDVIHHHGTYYNNTDGGAQGQGQGRPPRLSETLDRGAEILSNVFFGPKMKKLVSHWAPLKDGHGNVGWVVLVLTGAITT